MELHATLSTPSSFFPSAHAYDHSFLHMLSSVFGVAENGDGTGPRFFFVLHLTFYDISHRNAGVIGPLSDLQ